MACAGKEREDTLEIRSLNNARAPDPGARARRPILDLSRY
jgi:hypothetical protein